MSGRLGTRAKTSLRGWLARRGYRLTRIDPQEQLYRRGGFATALPLPPGAAETLRRDHPRLLELRRRYQRLDSPLGSHTLWDDRYRTRDLDLANFRGDNIYLWQLRNVVEHARLKYFMHGRYIASLDTRGLLSQLREDGAFGCWTFEYETLPRLSRDLLDSINELYFLDRELQIFSRSRLSVLDIGAGYGRLAYRMQRAIPTLDRYYCVDAVPESTFLSEFYLRHRSCLDKAVVVPLDELQATLPVGGIDVAVNIHSFSEVGLGTVAAWLDEIVRLRIEWLLIVPNESDKLLSWEVDGSRENYLPVLEAHGFRLRRCEPIFRDPDLRELIGVADYFFLFQRSSPA